MGLLLLLLSFVVAILSTQDSNAQTTYECGVAPLNTRIVGGTDAPAGSWPWQVSIHYNNRHICGGTLIHSQWVMTATHCNISRTNISLWTLYLGRQMQSTSVANPNEVKVGIQSIIDHPSFDDALYKNDISLLKLSQPVNFSLYIRPICLAANNSIFYNGTSCWATGWGNIGKDQALPAPQTLQQVQIPVLANSLCSIKYESVNNATITPQMICAGKANKGICDADSGGPLQCKQGSVWIQAGITSYGTSAGCALGAYPDVYTRVSEFQSWIKMNIQGSAIDFVTFTSNCTDANITCSNTASPHFTFISNFSILFITLISSFLILMVTTHANML